MALRLVLLVPALLLTACGEFHARPDLKVSTMTLPGTADCVYGHKIESTGTVGQYGTPIGTVTQERCKPASEKSP